MTVGVSWTYLKISSKKLIPKIVVIPHLCKIKIELFACKLICAVNLFWKRIPLNHIAAHDLQTITANFLVKSCICALRQRTHIFFRRFIAKILIQIKKAAHQFIVIICTIAISNTVRCCQTFTPAVCQSNRLFL